MPELFEARQEADGTWSIHDKETDVTAIINGVPQIGLERELAEHIAAELNRAADGSDNVTRE